MVVKKDKKNQNSQMSKDSAYTRYLGLQVKNFHHLVIRVRASS